MRVGDAATDDDDEDVCVDVGGVGNVDSAGSSDDGNGDAKDNDTIDGDDNGEAKGTGPGKTTAVLDDEDEEGGGEAKELFTSVLTSLYCRCCCSKCTRCL